ncbi:hypothetical protein GCM10009122_46080 [Fulvivirga kasyanovii]|uniref:EF-hand domain-containing protein n=1 Tax=Fulvivirga kasyanovii TaxID=396812 RepID=A0ABW9RWM6_9BACT|nr:hypothetical protein [Fulvivirga kasyanovii]MTI28649.1 hypothetical protein [Fulvivirga kasyanovii]
MKTISKITTALLIFLLISTAGFSQNRDNDYSTWDNNGDNKVDNNEFSSTLNDNGYYDDWDTNSDQRIDENEWNNGAVTYYDGYDYEEDGTFNDWDTNDDSYLDEDEYFEGTFELWDDDDNGYVDNNEYDTWYDDDSWNDNDY